MLRTVLMTLAVALAVNFASAERAVVLYGDQTFSIAGGEIDKQNLWIPSDDVAKIYDAEVGADSIELAEAQIKGTDSLVKTAGEQKLINVTALAAELGQSVVAEPEQGVWSFGQIPAKIAPYYESAVAPDFAITDREGNVVRLSDFRGKKVLLFTWASW